MCYRANVVTHLPVLFLRTRYWPKSPNWGVMAFSTLADLVCKLTMSYTPLHIHSADDKCIHWNISCLRKMFKNGDLFILLSCWIIILIECYSYISREQWGTVIILKCLLQHKYFQVELNFNWIFNFHVCVKFYVSGTEYLVGQIFLDRLITLIRLYSKA